ncbi:MAG: collagen-like protein, partial [Chloroflexi bacterium]|nr:collagen-like protein [Chloroflexota bacterium]
MFRRSILRLVFGSHKHLGIGIFFIVLVMILGVACSGDDGALGADGSQGADGAQGVDGVQGSAGEAGQAGSDGSDGRTGATGATGAQGATGPAGISARLLSLVNAPVLANGTVAGAPTEFVISLDVSMDPAMPGKTLLKGNTIKITLPDDFADTGSLAFKGVGSEDCVPGNLQCTTGVLLPGWPQHPIGPPFKMYDINLGGSNSIVFTALEDILPDPPLAPGIKQIHLILKRFTNPGPGQYRIKIEAETGPNGAVETSWGQLHIIPEIRPFISLTSAMNPGTPNTVYQSAAPGTSTPFGYDLLLWNSQGEALTG